MKRVLLNDDASIRSVLEGTQELISLNTPKDAKFVDDIEYISSTDYFDSVTSTFVSIGESPSQHHTFDYTTKQWIDPRSLDEIKAQKWAEIKSQRDQLEFGGFEFEGNVYDSDQVSQGRIMGAAVAGVEQTWTLANNTTVELTALQLQQLYAALQTHIAGVHERGRIARQLIFDAETKEQIEAIQL
ncbi:DUF4376 domain-containing protein [Acinetobacter towneri]|uniref:DUF4376 domain-containing protein n=1 Tax=Acinetobacter towneri TaxID=202956 RepID=A0AB35LXU2_9GAMM|nr:DUF4376 domain-containing protein [Acinetobacter towneri]MDM1718029.1 DUF4376 domain-containing protein [Acinetobacter towneri]MDM1734843.1 DUF4376 domain-containing protein [Acinetobacter towneri]MDM1738067.1 DUF4376 domain-containing protein [Acinetobacter towneri]MDM1741656.1 DUF4376 domain-containing protein [Acinetobacter towneri]MDM1745431.1 DUF4376 domain-containing protein [Acinetobacter towneri]